MPTYRNGSPKFQSEPFASCASIFAVHTILSALPPALSCLSPPFLLHRSFTVKYKWHLEWSSQIIRYFHVNFKCPTNQISHPFLWPSHLQACCARFFISRCQLFACSAEHNWRWAEYAIGSSEQLLFQFCSFRSLLLLCKLIKHP